MMVKKLEEAAKGAGVAYRGPDTISWHQRGRAGLFTEVHSRRITDSGHNLKQRTRDKEKYFSFRG